MSSLRLQRDS